MGKKKKPERPWEINNRLREKEVRERPEFLSVKKKIFSISSVQTLFEKYNSLTLIQEWHTNKKAPLDISWIDIEGRGIGTQDSPPWELFLSYIEGYERTLRHRKVLWITESFGENDIVYVYIPSRDLLKYDIILGFSRE